MVFISTGKRSDANVTNVQLEAIVSEEVKESTKANTLSKKHAAPEASTKVSMGKYALSLEKWKDVMGETPSRLEVDFGHSVGGSSGNDRTASGVPGNTVHVPSAHVSTVTLDADMVERIRGYCCENGVSMFSMALSSLHLTLRAYSSHEAFAIGVAHPVRSAQFRDTVGMSVNTVLVPFTGGDEGSTCTEAVKDTHERWMRDILPIASTPFGMVSSMGYGCNVYLAYNVGFQSHDDVENTQQVRNLLQIFYYDSIISSPLVQKLTMMSLGGYLYFCTN